MSGSIADSHRQSARRVRASLDPTVSGATVPDATASDATASDATASDATVSAGNGGSADGGEPTLVAQAGSSGEACETRFIF